MWAQFVMTWLLTLDIPRLVPPFRSDLLLGNYHFSMRQRRNIWLVHRPPPPHLVGCNIYWLVDWDIKENLIRNVLDWPWKLRKWILYQETLCVIAFHPLVAFPGPPFEVEELLTHAKRPRLAPSAPPANNWDHLIFTPDFTHEIEAFFLFPHSGSFMSRCFRLLHFWPIFFCFGRLTTSQACLSSRMNWKKQWYDLICHSWHRHIRCSSIHILCSSLTSCFLLLWWTRAKKKPELNSETKRPYCVLSQKVGPTSQIKCEGSFRATL
jgi:hypothetical protein